MLNLEVYDSLPDKAWHYTLQILTDSVIVASAKHESILRVEGFSRRFI
jgi:hypothetical protein